MDVTCLARELIAGTSTLSHYFTFVLFHDSFSRRDLGGG
jgi:hypothetical protein